MDRYRIGQKDAVSRLRALVLRRRQDRRALGHGHAARRGCGVDQELIFKEVAMILITGASGNAGGAVVKEVLKTNQPVKAMYRSSEDAAKASKDAGAVIADFAVKPSLGRALEGVDAVYLVCSPV